MVKPTARFLALGLLVLAAPAWSRPAAPLPVVSGWPLPPMLAGPAHVARQYGSITSGFRTASHNRLIGGVANSYHLLGQALDVARAPGVTHQMLDGALRRAGYRLLESLDEGDHSHFAFALPSLVAPTLTRSPPPAVAATVPPPKPPSRLLADAHGTLVVAGEPAAGVAPETRQFAAGTP